MAIVEGSFFSWGRLVTLVWPLITIWVEREDRSFYEIDSWGELTWTELAILDDKIGCIPEKKNI